MLKRISDYIDNKLKKKSESSEFAFKVLMWKVRINHKIALRKLREKGKIKVAFLLIHESVWKCEGVYRLMENDSLFDPIVVACPYTMYGEEVMHNYLTNAFNDFKERGYNVINSLKEDGTWLDVKKEINPDIVFFTNPHKEITKKKYNIHYFLDRLTCYVPYGIMAANIQSTQFDQDFHNLVWRGFYETQLHLMMSKKYARNSGKNIVISGYPTFDWFKISDHNKTKKSPRRIVWAPHHTIEDDGNQLGYSTFLRYHDYFLELANDFRESISFIFKPHPLLRAKLINHPEWGIKRTEEYYSKWSTGGFGEIHSGDYRSLFADSDGMILDSISFISEFLYTEKPLLFLVKDHTIAKKFNEYGKEVFNLLYKAHELSSIKRFLTDVILGTNDHGRIDRVKFKNKFLIPPSGSSASENIFNYIKSYCA